MFYRGAHAILGCYDLNEPETLVELFHWIRDCAETHRGCPLFIVGCKSDLVTQTPEEAERWTFSEFDGTSHLQLWKDHFDILMRPTSAKTGQGVKELFNEVAHVCHRNKSFPGAKVGPRGGVQLPHTKQKLENIAADGSSIQTSDGQGKCPC